MINFSLYRKEIEMLEITKQLFLAGNYHGGYRESIAELFYENNEHFRQEFLEIIPVKNLEKTKELLFFLRTVNSSQGGGLNSTIGAMYRGNRKVQDVIDDMTELQDMIKTECNRRFRFGIFYSWQSDTESKYNRNFIEDALEKSVKDINKDIIDGPLLSVDKDTRGVPGSPDIVTTILQKIDKSVCFLADVTPIGKMGEKSIPNPNVMFELGFALSSLSFERVILICNTAYGELNELPFDLGLKRIIPYRYYKNTGEEEKRECKQKLIATLNDAIKAIVNL